MKTAVREDYFWSNMQANGTVNIGETQKAFYAAYRLASLSSANQTQFRNDYMIEHAINIVFIKLSNALEFIFLYSEHLKAFFARKKKAQWFLQQLPSASLQCS